MSRKFKLYKQAIGWIKSAEDQSGSPQRRLIINGLPYDAVPQNMIDVIDARLREEALYIINNFTADQINADPVLRYRACYISPKFPDDNRRECILRRYITGAIQNHEKKVSGPLEDRDPTYALQQIEVVPEIIDGNPNGQSEIAPEYKLDPASYSPYAVQGFDVHEEPTLWSNALEMGFYPFVLSSYINQPESTPEMFKGLEKRTGMKFWPVEDAETANAAIKKSFMKDVADRARLRRLQKLNYERMSRLTNNQLSGGGLDLSYPGYGWRFGRKAFQYGMPLMVFGTEGSSAYDRFMRAKDDESYSEAAKDILLGGVHAGTAAGFGAEALASSSRLVNTMERMRALKAIRALRGAGRMGGALFAATTIAEPLIDFTDTYYTGMPIVDAARRKKNYLDTNVHNFRDAIMHPDNLNEYYGYEDPENPNNYSHLYKTLVKNDTGGKDETNLPETGGYFGLYGQGLAQSYSNWNPFEVGPLQAYANIRGYGSKDSPTLNPARGLVNLFTSYDYHPAYQAPKPVPRDKQITEDNYQKLLNNTFPMYDVPSDKQQYWWFPTKYGYMPVAEGQIYNQLGYRKVTSHSPTATTGGSLLSAYLAGKDNYNKALYIDAAQQKEQKKEERKRGVIGPSRKDAEILLP